MRSHGMNSLNCVTDQEIYTHFAVIRILPQRWLSLTNSFCVNRQTIGLHFSGCKEMLLIRNTHDGSPETWSLSGKRWSGKRVNGIIASLCLAV